MQNIKNIIFDLGGVILNLDFPAAERAFEKLGVGHFKDIFGHNYMSSLFKDYEVGKISDNQFLQSLKELAGPDTSIQDVTDGWNAMLLDFPPERIELLDRLAKDYRVFLFSNTNSIHLTAFRQKYSDAFGGRKLDDHFEKAYYSHLLGMRKPSVQSYQQILKENGLEGSETLFIDDSLPNIEGANAAGLRGFHLKPGMTILDIEWDGLVK